MEKILQLKQELKKSIKKGHWWLPTSGYHTNSIFYCDGILFQIGYLELIVKEFKIKFEEILKNVDYICSNRYIASVLGPHLTNFFPQIRILQFVPVTSMYKKTFFSCAFQFEPDVRLNKKKILIVNDNLSTGSTIISMVDIIENNDAELVGVFTILQNKRLFAEQGRVKNKLKNVKTEFLFDYEEIWGEKQCIYKPQACALCKDYKKYGHPRIPILKGI